MRRLLTLLVLALSTTLALATPAHAGGPTSVLITAPSSGEATALYYSDPAYTELDRLVSGATPLDGEPADLGRGVTATWMIHDVSPWRTQQLYPDAAGGPVVATDGGGWARVKEGKALQVLLDSALEPGATTVVTAAAPEPVVQERVVTETPWWSLAGWRWAVLGLLVGAGAVLLVRRPAGARQPLVDLDPGAEVLTR